MFIIFIFFYGDTLITSNDNMHGVSTSNDNMHGVRSVFIFSTDQISYKPTKSLSKK